MMNMTETVKQLLIINVLFYIGSYFVPQSYDLLSLHYFESDGFKFWQPITHMFMHSKHSLLHIFFNMFALVSFGSSLEQFWGPKKFLFFYFSCGLGAALIHSGVNYYEIHSLLNQLENTSITSTDIHTILNTDFVSGNQYYGKLLYENAAITFDKLRISENDFGVLFNAAVKNQSTAVGASGAIYGLLVAFAFMFPNAQLGFMFIPIPISAKYFVPIYILLYDGFFGLVGTSIMGIDSGIAHFAHLGGALFGFIMMWYWKKNQFDKNRWDR
jgi:membrane associated rhomboid family serine protease